VSCGTEAENFAIGVVKGQDPMGSEVKYVTVSIPKAMADEIDVLIGELGYWSSRSSFIREACLEKIRKEVLRLREFGARAIE